MSINDARAARIARLADAGGQRDKLHAGDPGQSVDRPEQPGLIPSRDNRDSEAEIGLCKKDLETMQKNLEAGVSHVVHAGEGERFDVLGAHLVWKARGHDTDGAFTVAVQTLGPSEYIPPHRHQYPEVFFVTSGELVFTLTRNGEAVEETVAQGGTVIVAANSYHGVRNTSGADATLLDIACFEHQQFFDDVQREHPSWEGLTPEQTMQQVGAIGMRHTLEFRMPD